MLIDALYTLLSQVNANTYPGVTEQEIDPPFIVHAIAKTIPYPSKDGKSTIDVSIVKVASYDTTQRAAQTLADAVRVKIDEYDGVVNLMDIHNIRFVDEENGYDPENNIYYTLQTYRIWVNYNT